jgi:hypothetical protein
MKWTCCLDPGRAKTNRSASDIPQIQLESERGGSGRCNRPTTPAPRGTQAGAPLGGRSRSAPAIDRAEPTARSAHPSSLPPNMRRRHKYTNLQACHTCPLRTVADLPSIRGDRKPAAVDDAVFLRISSEFAVGVQASPTAANGPRYGSQESW